MQLSKAIHFIETHGTPIEQAQLAAMLEAAPAPDDVLADLIAPQHADGSYPYNGVKSNPASLQATATFIQTLIDLDEGEHDATTQAMNWLLTQQSPRGWWRESAALTMFEPPLWMDAESDAALVYTTALVAMTLAQLEDPMAMVGVDTATTWLQGQIPITGLLPGFRIQSTSLAIPAFVAIGHRETRTVKRMVGGLGDLLSNQWDAPSLAILLTGLSVARFPRLTKIVERALTVLSKQQQPDGSWCNEDDQPNASLTLSIVRAARRFGLK